MTTADVSAARTGGTGSPRPGPGAARPGRRRRLRLPPKALPYLLLAPAVAAELVVHLVPIAVGIWMSFKELTLFSAATASGRWSPSSCGGRGRSRSWC